MSSQAARLRDAVLAAAHGSAFGQGTPTEYFRSRAGDAAAGATEGAAGERLSARWSGMLRGQRLAAGGFAEEVSGIVRIAKDAFADGYVPRAGDLVRVVDGRLWQVREVLEAPLEGEWKLGLFER